MGNILILEDDFVLADDFATALKACGHGVVLAGTATEAIAHCDEVRVDLAIVDIFIRQDDNYVPDGGLSLISKIRHTTGLKTPQDIPVIAVSGGALVQSKHDPLVSAQAIGATATMVKPIDLLMLIEMVESHLPSPAAE